MNTILSSESLENRTLSHKELATFYFPEISARCASRRLKQWILEDKTLVRHLTLCGWTVSRRLLSPLMVHYIVEAFGAPW